jgi:hypothetical protein
MNSIYKDIDILIDDLNNYSSSTIIYSTFPIFKIPIFYLDIKEDGNNIDLDINYKYTNVWKQSDWKEDIIKNWLSFTYNVKNTDNYTFTNFTTHIKNKVLRTITYGLRQYSFNNILKGLIPLNGDKDIDYKQSDTISYIIYKENRILEDKIIK